MFDLRAQLRAPEDGGGDSLGGSTGVNEDLELLNDETPPEPNREEVQEEEEEDSHEEVEHEESEEERQAREEEEEEQAKPHELAPHDRPTFTDLKTYDPELFKEFPGLKDVLFRERAYTELFTNIDDAKQALENSTAFENSKQSIFEGDATSFLESIKETDAKALSKFASMILPALYKVDQDSHWAAANPILESMVKGFNASAKDDKTKEAAKLFAEWMFGDIAQDILDGKKTFVPEVKPETKKDPEREQFLQERFQAFDSDVRVSAMSGLASFIASKDAKGKDRLDPDEVFSSWMRKTIVEKISLEVRQEMEADKDHMRYMNGLWEKARKNGYKPEWKTRISSAFLARARQLVPAVRSRIVSEALGKQVRRADKTRTVVKRSLPNTGTGGRSSGTSGKLDSSRKIDYSKTSDEDLINDNITYKG